MSDGGLPTKKGAKSTGVGTITQLAGMPSQVVSPSVACEVVEVAAHFLSLGGWLGWLRCLLLGEKAGRYVGAGGWDVGEVGRCCP